MRQHVAIQVLGLCLGLVLAASTAAGSGSMVSYKSGSDQVEGYFSPGAGPGKHPALIMVHEWWGLVDWVKQQADTLASMGYSVLAVDLYRGKTASTPDVAHELSRALPEDRAAQDLQAAYDFLRSRDDVESTRMGSIGWCMGGGYSLMAATTLKGLSASVVCYGRLVTSDTEIIKIACPVLGIFGGKDRGIPPEAVNAFQATAKKLGKDITTQIYDDAGHAFMNPNNTQGFKPEDARDANRRIYAFLDEHLKH